MKKILFQLTVIFALGAILSSCSGDSNPVMKNATGKPGETIVVIPKNYWKGAVGDTIFHFLAQPVADLPKDEPMLNVVHIPPEAFSEIFKTGRNILLTKISPSVKEPSIKIQRNVWSKPQLIVTVQAPDEKSFVDFFAKRGNDVVSIFVKGERDRLMKMYADRKFKNEAVASRMEKEHHFTINVPKGFAVSVDTTNFVWIRYETPNISQDVIAYWYPYTSDSTFTKKYLLDKRDSVVKKNVPGPDPGTYMTTERLIPVLFRAFKLNGNYTAMMRGLWKVHGGFMGGPFVSISTLDPVRGRVLTLEGFVYAPKMDKRELMRQMEAMIYSVRFPDQAKNDRINRMAEMGNDTEATPADSASTK
ncbi:DUF4837 family protein [Prolixibacter bellariivorans]|nr:DUF4837 family protein [Prolixibacter bellariivorans]